MIRSLRAAIASTGSTEGGWRIALLGLPTRIHAMFWVTILVLGWPSHAPHGPASIALWMLVATLSIWLHELGHAMLARQRGVVFAIHLHATGGSTEWRPLGTLRWHWRAAVIAGGPLAGAACVLVAWPLTHLTLSPRLALAAHDLLWLNGAWTAFNLLPMEPLDGGQLLRAILERRGQSREGLIAAVGVAIAAVAFMALLLAEHGYAAVTVVFFGVYNLERLQAHRDTNRRTGWSRLSDEERVRDRY
jgi:stage IV sporulation protein FB